MVIGKQAGRDGGTHPLKIRGGLRRLIHGAIGLHDGGVQLVGGHGVGRVIIGNRLMIGTKIFAHCSDGELTGHLSTGAPADPVGHDKQTKLFIYMDEVFIPVAHAAKIGFPIRCQYQECLPL